MTKWMVEVKDLLKTRLIAWFGFLILLTILFSFIVFPYWDPVWWYVTFSLITMFLTMTFFETILMILKSMKLKARVKPKVFEFGFFLNLFFATLSASIMIAMVFQPELTDEDKIEIIKQQFWFIGLYGVAIAFGIYHYLFRIDSDIPIKKEKSD